MATVRQMLDKLDDGSMSIDQVADDFRSRKWQKMHKLSPAMIIAGEDYAPVPDSWDEVNEDGRLSTYQYGKLAEAYLGAVSQNVK